MTADVADDVPPEIAQAAREAAERGLRFATTREEIEQGAAQEDTLNIIWALQGAEPSYIESFTDRWPNIQNVEIIGSDGVEERQRFLLEAAAGALDDWSIAYAGNEVYNETADLCDWDLYGMAEHGIIDIPPQMIDHNTRVMVSTGNSSSVFIYNLEAFEDVPLPETWDDIIENPDIYGPGGPIRLAADVRLATFSALVPEWGLDRAKEWYGTLAEEVEPTWVSRFGPMVPQIEQGEFHAMPFVNLHNANQLLTGGPPQEERSAPDIIGEYMGIKFIEPVPLRITDTHCVVKEDFNNPSPYTGILWLEWLASCDGQAWYEHPLHDAPYQGSVHTDCPGGLAELLDGLQVSAIDWDHLLQQSGYIDEIIAEAGFPEPID